MNPHHIARMMLVLILLVVAGCAFQQRITYTLDDIKASEVDVASRLILDIQSFEDIRESVPENSMFFSEGRETRAPGKLSCINSEKHYEQGTVPLQIANIMAEHLNKRGAFKLVTVNRRENADFYLTGKVKRFAGVQDFSKGAAVAASFGLFGALATLGMKTQGIIDIKFTDLAVYKRGGTLLTQIDDVEERFQGELKTDAYCWKIYRNVNERLRSVIDKLGDEIEERIVSLEFKTQ